MTGNEDSQKRAECEAIQRDARKVAATYRQMAGLNSIADTPGDVRDSWRERVVALEGRRARYCEGWGVNVPNPRLFKTESRVSPEWLQEIVNTLDIIVWQLDHEF